MHMILSLASQRLKDVLDGSEPEDYSGKPSVIALKEI